MKKFRSDFMKKNCPMFNEESRKKSSLTHTGKKLSPETCRKLSEVKKGKTPKNINYLMKKGKKTRFQKGLTPWNKGLHPYDEETKKKISLAQIGKKASRITKQKMSKSHQGFKHTEESKLKMSGENCHLWRGGISFEPYGLEFNQKLRNEIRSRDNQVCMNCGIHREKVDRVLCVHHVNYDKSCNIKENLITVCLPCHASTNLNREYWIKLFQGKLARIYNYKYASNGDIILEVKE